MKKSFILFLLTGIVAGMLSMSCSKKQAKVQNEKRTITVAYRQNDIPYSWINEKGETVGYEYDLLREVEKLLPQYKFKYIGTTQEDALIGLDAGRNHIVLSGLWNCIPSNHYYICRIRFIPPDNASDNFPDFKFLYLDCSGISGSLAAGNHHIHYLAFYIQKKTY